MKKPKISTDVKPAKFSSLFKESDMGCVLLIGSFLDTLLRNILFTAIAANLFGEKLPKKFFKEKIPNHNGPFHTFDHKIVLAYTFKFINIDQYEALQAVRDLRNEAAHCVFTFSLTNNGVSTHLNKMEKYIQKVGQDQVMNFEDFLPTTDTEEGMAKFTFISISYELFNELDEIHGIQLERLTAKLSASDGKEKTTVKAPKPKAN
jgi:hypothetical protein